MMLSSIFVREYTGTPMGVSITKAPGEGMQANAHFLSCVTHPLVRIHEEDAMEVKPKATVGHMNIPFAKA
jgi:hypothetical protein